MKVKFNLPIAVTNMLKNCGYDADAVQNAVQSALNQFQLDAEVAKAKVGSITNTIKGNSKFSETETVKRSYLGKSSWASIFGAWCQKVQAATDMASFEISTVPPRFAEWLTTFKVKVEA